MRVVIDTQVIHGGNWGGIEQFILGLVHALGKLEDGDEEYILIAHWQDPDWLKPYLGRNQRIVVAPPPPSEKLEPAKRLLGPFRKTAGRILRWTRRRILGSAAASRTAAPFSFYDSLGADVVHFPHQAFTRCRAPIIYTPHDLQHLHYPEFFMPEEIAAREATYPVASRYAAAVATDAQWVKEDISRQYGIDPAKIYSIPMGPPTELYGEPSDTDLDEARATFQLPPDFVLYPAQTWAHKNHLRLLDAVALLRDRDGIKIHLICTGRKNAFWGAIEKRVVDLDVTGQVRFFGFVAPEQLRAIYRLASFIVFPSLFEGGGLPILEAFCEGKPVACSNVTSLPEYAGEAALLFDPSSVESIAGALRQMSLDSDLREALRQRGAARMRLFTWERTALAYRALYRKLAGRPLSNKELKLLMRDGQ